MTNSFLQRLQAFARQQNVTASKHLTPADISSLKQGRDDFFSSTTIEEVLKALPIIPKGKYLGKLPIAGCHRNTLAIREKKGEEAYTGYVVKPPLVMFRHSFNVVDGKVQEHTKFPKPGVFESYIYLGVPIPESITEHTVALDKKIFNLNWVKKAAQAMINKDK